MTAAYRTMPAAPTETIVLAPEARWYGLILAIPYALTYSGAFMNVVAPIPPLEGVTGFCGNTARNYGEYSSAVFRAGTVREMLFVVALAGVVFALTSLWRRPSSVIVVDRTTRILTVKTGGTESRIAFGDRPILIRRDGGYWLHAGKLAPVQVAPTRTSHDGIERLRAALATLTSAHDGLSGGPP